MTTKIYYDTQLKKISYDTRLKLLISDCEIRFNEVFADFSTHAFNELYEASDIFSKRANFSDRVWGIVKRQSYFVHGAIEGINGKILTTTYEKLL